MLTLSQVCALPNDSWIEDGFFAVVREIKSKQAGPKAKNPGKTFWVVTLADQVGPETAELAMFFAPKFREGDVVEFTGLGIKHTVNNYGSKVSIGQETVITAVGQSAHAPEQVARAAVGAPAVDGRPQLVPGPTVGMAINNALNLLSRDMSHDDLVSRLISPPFWASVHEVASDIIRVSRLLEHGKLAEPIKVRCSGAIQSPPPSPRDERRMPPLPAHVQQTIDADNIPF